MATTILGGDNHHFGGTPLAMLAAQCNKMSSKSPPPLADAVAGKGFYPCKKPSLTHLTLPTGTGSSLQISANGQRMPTLNGSMSMTSSPLNYLQPNCTSSSYTVPYPSNLFYSHGTTQLESQQSLLQKLHADNQTYTSMSNMSGLYSRVAPTVPSHHYDSWPYSMATSAAGTHPTASLKQDATGNGSSASSWWDMHNATSNWLADISSPANSYSPLGNYNTTDYNLSSLTSKASPLMASSGQSYYQDSYKTMLPPQTDYATTISSPFSGHAGLSAIPSARSQRRYTGRATCDCPHCQEADRFGPAGANLKKRNIHSCHIPGCGKVYAKTSHLKAHLRWHTRERSFVCNMLFCGKRFSRSDELQIHLQTHNGEKRLACPICNKGFMRNDHLTKHMKTHNDQAKKENGSCSDSESSKVNESSPSSEVSPHQMVSNENE